MEYAALCTQTYRNAWMAVKKTAGSETKNWVVVLDVDETVLDNSKYALERAAVNSAYTKESWVNWVFRKEAVLVPGAKTFIDNVRTLGPKAHIAYITNRDFEQEQPTIENLQKYGLFKEGDFMLTRKSREDTKVDRRRCLETGSGRCEGKGPMIILALLGDNVRDFIPMQGSENARQYRDSRLAEDLNWGQKYFVLPNPTYGSWEQDYQ